MSFLGGCALFSNKVFIGMSLLLSALPLLLVSVCVLGRAFRPRAKSWHKSVPNRQVPPWIICDLGAGAAVTSGERNVFQMVAQRGQ